MFDVLYFRTVLGFVWLLNHIPFGPRFDLEILEIELEASEKS